MPRWLRQFTFNKISEFYRKEVEKSSSRNEGNKSTLVDPSGNINKQAFKEASSKTMSGPKVRYK